MATLCEKCFHGNLCLHRGIMGKEDEKTLICCGNFIATADVVPKSEVERLYKEIDRLSQVVLYHDSFKADEIKDAKADVAREIFEEIEDRLLPSNTSGEFRGDSIEWFDYYDLHLAEDIAELKKKYTGAVK